MAEWISVEKRLPLNNRYVLVHNGVWTGVGKYVRRLKNSERWQDEHLEFIELLGPKVTHWMPLPPPPSKARSDSDRATKE